jgi:hypothetical protein
VQHKEAAKKAAQKQRQKKTCNAAKAIQLPQKGKRKASQPPIPKNKRQKQCSNAAHSGARAEAPTPLPPVTTRSGRNVKLPSKYI